MARAFLIMFTPGEGQENVIEYMKTFKGTIHKSLINGKPRRIGVLPKWKDQYLRKHSELDINIDG